MRERIEDIPLLIEHFLGKYGGPSHQIEMDVAQLFERYHWPGNIRELENSIRRLVTVSPDGVITLAETRRHLPDIVEAVKGLTDSQKRSWREECKRVGQSYERQRLLEALERYSWNQTRAARELRISQPALNRKMKKHGLRKPGEPRPAR